MAFKYRSPSIKIGGVTIRKNQKGYSISGKTLTGGRKTYNTHTGKTTKTYKTGIKGLSYTTTSGGYKKTSQSANKPKRIGSNVTNQTKSKGKGIIAIIALLLLALLDYVIYLIPVALIAGGIYWYVRKRNSSRGDEMFEDTDAISTDTESNEIDLTDEITNSDNELNTMEETAAEE